MIGSVDLSLLFMWLAVIWSLFLKVIEMTFFSEPLYIPRPPMTLAGFRLPKITIEFEGFRKKHEPLSIMTILDKNVVLSADYDKHELRVPTPLEPASPMQARGKGWQKSKAEPLQINFEME